MRQCRIRVLIWQMTPCIDVANFKLRRTRANGKWQMANGCLRLVLIWQMSDSCHDACRRVAGPFSPVPELIMRLASAAGAICSRRSFRGEVICACLQQKFLPGLMDWRLVRVPTGFPHSVRTGGGGGKCICAIFVAEICVRRRWF